MTIYHKHHIIPKHMGGTDDSSNLIELTVEQHAEAHRILYETYGNPKDYAAWQGLSGIMNKSEIIKYVQSESSKKNNKKRVEEGIHQFLGDKNPSKRLVKLGKHHFQKNIGNRPVDKVQRKLVSEGNHHWQSKLHAEFTSKNSRRRIKEGTHAFAIIVTCPHCGKLGQKSAMNRWHFESCSIASS